ncbi:glycoside hydrolase [Ramicandelaber brevisporus]|nr:glycoside hydrolase [Ramicandelaber brevisporus]
MADQSLGESAYYSKQQPPITERPARKPHVIAYYTSWSIYARNFQPADIHSEHLTHLLYAFANVTPDGEIALGDRWADIDKPFPGDNPQQQPPPPFMGAIGQINNPNGPVRRRNPHLRTLISVGGWTWSRNFSNTLATPASREKFANSCIAFMTQYGFNGIDIDFEYPVEGGIEGMPHRPDDAINLASFMALLRSKLDALSAQTKRKYDLMMAVSANPKNIHHYIVGPDGSSPLKTLAKVCDTINIMAYDFAGSWSSHTGHQASLFAPSFDPKFFSGHQAVNLFVAGGAPPEKLAVGVPFYGRGFAQVRQEPHRKEQQVGLNCEFHGSPQGSWEQGVFDYAHIAREHLQPGSGYVRYWDPTAKAPFLFSESQRVFISYDDEAAIAEKTKYVVERRLGGVFAWELSNDRNAVLLNSISKTLHHKTS